jgi:hypothetical protein
MKIFVQNMYHMYRAICLAEVMLASAARSAASACALVGDGRLIGGPKATCRSGAWPAGESAMRG